MRASRWVIGGALLVTAGGLAQPSSGPTREEVASRLEAERLLLESTVERQGQLLELLETAQLRARASERRVALLSGQLARMTREQACLEATGGVLRVARISQEQELGPKLQLLARLSRRGQLGLWVSADDLAGAVRRGRAVRSLVDGGLRQLDELRAMAQLQGLAAAQLEHMRLLAGTLSEALARENAVLRARQGALGELHADIIADSMRSRRLVAELEAAERGLSRLLEEPAGRGLRPDEGSFRRRKGRLPFPARGVIEVGFGRVLNPRFNTVTVHNGLDLRAQAGTPVIAVASGTVVYSGWLRGFGNLVIVDHGGGFHTLYAHLEAVEVEVGAEVEAEPLGSVGDTGSLKGAFLYFELRHQGKPIDPIPWLSEDVLPQPAGRVP